LLRLVTLTSPDCLGPNENDSLSPRVFQGLEGGGNDDPISFANPCTESERQDIDLALSVQGVTSEDARGPSGFVVDVALVPSNGRE